MDAELHGPEAALPDPHGWNSLDRFITIHETRLGAHPFVDHDQSHTLSFDSYQTDDGRTFYVLHGAVFCRHDVTVEVTKYYETRVVAGRIQVRGFSYRYNASVRGRHNVLRYDNGHDDAPDEFHRHQYSVADGTEIETRIISRHQLPTFADILTELETMFEGQT